MSLFDDIYKDFWTTVRQPDDIKTSKTIGVYVIYVDCPSPTVLPMVIKKSKNIGSHYRSFISSLKAFIANKINYNDELDILVYKRFCEYLSANKLDLDAIKIKVLALCKEEDLDETEIYYCQRFLTGITSFGHTLFVQELRRIEYKSLYSKDNDEVKRLLSSMLLKVYKVGTIYLTNLIIYSDLFANCNCAKENLNKFAHYIFVKGLLNIEDEDFLILQQLKLVGFLYM